MTFVRARTFTLTVDGEEARELTTVLGGRLTTFQFPYTTNDQQEIDYLLRQGAKSKRTLTSRPTYPYNVEPLKGGDEK